MKCCHLVAALALAGCGLNSSALPNLGRGTDAGAKLDAAREPHSIAGAPATWPVRRRPGSIDAEDGGSGDTPQREAPGSDAEEPTAPAVPGGQAEPSSSGPNPAAGPSEAGAGASKPGSQSASAGSARGGASSNGTPSGAAATDAGASSPAGPNGQADTDEPSAPPSEPQSNGGQRSGSSGHGDQATQGHDTINAIVELVIAILDLSLGPIRPAEIEALVSAILVLSLAPADLAAESLIAVLDALDDTRICLDHPERCNPLCTNLESDCSACGEDRDCIERIEEMCKVRLPRSCYSASAGSAP